MTKYIVTITNRYEVKAESPEQALMSCRVHFEDVDPWELIIPEHCFEYIGTKGEVEEAK